MSVYVHTFLQLSKYAIDLVNTEAKKVKRFLQGLNPTYKKMVVASNKPTTFDDAVDRAFTAEEVHREEMVENAKRSSGGTTGSLFKKERSLRIRIRGKSSLRELKTSQSVRRVARPIGLRHVEGPLEHV